MMATNSRSFTLVRKLEVQGAGLLIGVKVGVEVANRLLTSPNIFRVHRWPQPKQKKQATGRVRLIILRPAVA